VKIESHQPEKDEEEEIILGKAQGREVNTRGPVHRNLQLRKISGTAEYCTSLEQVQASLYAMKRVKLRLNGSLWRLLKASRFRVLLHKFVRRVL
jgi:hypothetical protein